MLSHYLRRLGAALFGGLYWTALLVMVATAVLGLLGIVFLASHAPDGSPVDTSGIVGTVRDYSTVVVSGVFDGSVPFSEAQRRLVDQLTNGLVFTLTILAILWSTLYVVKEKRLIASSVAYRTNNFGAKDGDVNSGALKIMQRYYKNATAIRVVAGDYDWLLADGNDIHQVVLRLLKSGKANLLSYKTRVQVEAVWGERAQEEDFKTILNAIQFNARAKHKLSLIQYRENNKSLVFLARVDGEERAKGSDPIVNYTIYEFPDRGSVASVVEMAEQLFDLGQPPKPKASTKKPVTA